MKKLFRLAVVAASAIMAFSCNERMDDASFFDADNGHFILNGEKQYYIGTNFWYGPILASDTEAGDLKRLEAELDSLKSLGIENLRVLVGAEGPEGTPYKISPVLQPEPGVYDERMFRGLDRFLVELGKRKMSAVLYFTNSWEWSGGFGQYLEWAGAGKAVLPQAGWGEFVGYASKIMMDEKAKAMIADYVKTVVSRVNTVSGKPYSEDPAIFSWQLANEPRCFSASKDVQDAFVDWVYSTAALIKTLDPNHMVSTGSEGMIGCELSMDLFEKIHACPDIDYMNIHIWPYNWRWVPKEGFENEVQAAIEKTDAYINEHLKIADKCGKPLVIEEFGYPRDALAFAKGTSTRARDEYYSHLFRRLAESAASNGKLAGVNFWGWGGMANQSEESVWWSSGDDFCCDPAHEQQGLYSVYQADNSTVSLIRRATSELR